MTESEIEAKYRATLKKIDRKRDCGLRVECLRMAISTRHENEDADAIVARADAFLTFTGYEPEGPLTSVG